MTSEMPVSFAAAGNLDRLEDAVAMDDCTAEQVCSELARVFRVRAKEVALLQVDSLMLKFLYPQELRAAGAIPLSSPAVASRTVSSRRADCFNNFPSVQHSSIFETVRFSASNSESSGVEALTIQKLMSVPVFGVGKRVAGVIQVCRKGFDLASCGPDFTPEDLELLKSAAKVVGVFLARQS